jgi:hypothetical protein
MKDYKMIISAAILAVSVVILGLCLKSGIDSFVNRDRQVTVRGLCEKEVEANKVTWPIVTKEMGNDLPTIYDNIQKNNQALLSFLKQNGIEESEISINAPQVTDNMANSYDASRIVYRYSVTNVMVITSSKISKVRDLMSKQAELLRQGIAVVAGDWNYPTTYEYTDLNSIKPEMIATATANAREAADKFAADSHSHLGKIKTASQGQFSIEDRDQYTPYIKTVRVVTYITYELRD